MKQKQGNAAEIKFLLLNLEMGYTVSRPFGEQSRYDLIVDTGITLERVQVKSTSRKDLTNGMDCYNCQVYTQGYVKRKYVKSNSNSKKYILKKYTKKEIDFIAIYVVPEGAWYKIPIEEINGYNVKLYPHRKSRTNKFEKYRMNLNTDK